MYKFQRKIEHRSDVTAFFIHLRVDILVNFHPDARFQDYVTYKTREPTFDASTSSHYEAIMDACFGLCGDNDLNIYELALECLQFEPFLASHKAITNKQEMIAFLTEFIDENYGVEGIAVLHTYCGCYCIEEFREENKTMFQCIIENTHPYADSLREIEIILFDWIDKNPVTGLSAPPSAPPAIRNRKDIVRFFAYILNDCLLDERFDDRHVAPTRRKSRQPSFTKRQFKQFDRLTRAARRWCQTHYQDMYELGLAVKAFFDTYSRHTDQDAFDTLYSRFLGNRHKPPYLVALHLYEPGYWIEESMSEGRPYFETWIDNKKRSGYSLREIEITLFEHWYRRS